MTPVIEFVLTFTYFAAFAAVALALAIGLAMAYLTVLEWWRG